MTTTDDKRKRKCKCVICNGLIIGHGHDAAPVKEGQCCDHCNTHIVMPKRLEMRGTKLRFPDGMTIETSGEYRTIRRRDGWYVVGQGHCIPVESEQEGENIIHEMKQGASS
jgi:hypothetical protein